MMYCTIGKSLLHLMALGFSIIPANNLCLFALCVLQCEPNKHTTINNSVRKHANDLKNNLENIVIPMFCSAEISKFNSMDNGYISLEMRKTHTHTVIHM